MVRRILGSRRSIVGLLLLLLLLCQAVAAPPRTCEACSPRELDHLSGMPLGSQRSAFADALSAQCVLLSRQRGPPDSVFVNIALALSDLGEHTAAFELARGVHDARGDRDGDVALLAASLAKQVGQNEYCASVAQTLIQSRIESGTSRIDTAARVFGLLAACQHRQGNPSAAALTHQLAVQYGAYPSKDPRRPGGAAHWNPRLGDPHPIWEKGMLKSLGKNGRNIVRLLEKLEEESSITLLLHELEAWEEARRQQQHRPEQHRPEQHQHATKSLWVQEHQNLVDVTGHWHELYLFREGRFEVGTEGACHVWFSQTCAMLEKYKSLFHPTGHIKLSRIRPGSKVWPHSGGTNTKLRGHLGVVVGEHAEAHARLNVAGMEVKWTVGKSFVFDDTFEHSVEFPSSSGSRGIVGGDDRIVLLFDIFHPSLKKSSKIRMRRKARRLQGGPI